ncbi:MAG: lipoyl(octanoyl) transferase LipB, partial [Candidatus Binatia bacterium]
GMATQRRLFAERLDDRRPDTLLLLEHPPTITLGKRATAADLRRSPSELARSGVAVFHVGRGGAATAHAPGQLVGYPIVRLGRGGRSVRQYVAGLEEVLCAAAARFGVAAGTRRDHPGVWVGEAKLASIGVEVHRGVSLHGFALNVDMDLAVFAAIVPCGLPELVPTDLSRACGVRVSVADAAAAVIAAWRERFGDIEEEDPNERSG